jgi:hypothetical protein
LQERKKPKPGEKVEAKKMEPEGKRAFPLNSDDVIFESIRDLGINSVGPSLKEQLRKVSMAYEVRQCFIYSFFAVCLLLFVFHCFPMTVRRPRQASLAVWLN